MMDPTIVNISSSELFTDHVASSVDPDEKVVEAGLVIFFSMSLKVLHFQSSQSWGRVHEATVG